MKRDRSHVLTPAQESALLALRSLGPFTSAGMKDRATTSRRGKRRWLALRDVEEGPNHSIKGLLPAWTSRPDFKTLTFRALTQKGYASSRLVHSRTVVEITPEGEVEADRRLALRERNTEEKT